MNQSSVTPAPVSSGVEGPQGGSSTMKWLLIILVIIIVLGGGYLLWTKYSGGTSTATSSPSPTVTVKASPSTSAAVSPSASSSVPADWKTYTNETYGYKISYPSSWIINSSNTKEISIYTEASRTDVKSVTQTVGVKVSDETLEQFKSNFLQADPGINKVESEKTINFAGVSATQLTLSNAEGLISTVNFIRKGSNSFTITYFSAEATASQILSTFQFTPVK